MTAPVPVGLFQATPLEVWSNPTKLTYILDRLVEHETEWSDFQKARREIAAARLAEAWTAPDRTRILEVWRLPDSDGGTYQLVGLIAFTEIVVGLQASLHPVFFDGKLRNALGKRDLLLRSMDWAFATFQLHRLSMELPDSAFALVDFARKKLGFRFEGEGRTIKVRRAQDYGHLKRRSWQSVTPTASQAEMGSRRHQALLKHGQWHDILLLSVTADEFAAFVRERAWDSSSTTPTPSKPSPRTSGDSAAPSSKPSSASAEGEPLAPKAAAPVAPSVSVGSPASPAWESQGWEVNPRISAPAVPPSTSGPAGSSVGPDKAASSEPSSA